MNPIIKALVARQVIGTIFRPKPTQPKGEPLGKIITDFFGRRAQPNPGLAGRPLPGQPVLRVLPGGNPAGAPSVRGAVPSQRPALHLLPRDPMAKRPGEPLAAWYTRLPREGLVSEWRELRQVRSELVARLRRGALSAEDRQFMADYRGANDAFIKALRNKGLRFQDLVALERKLNPKPAAQRSAQQPAQRRKVA